MRNVITFSTSADVTKAVRVGKIIFANKIMPHLTQFQQIPMDTAKSQIKFFTAVFTQRDSSPEKTFCHHCVIPNLNYFVLWITKEDILKNVTVFYSFFFMYQ